jgi:hypothetical protein
MKRHVLALTMALATWLGSGSAAAQVLGNSGDAVFGAERLFGIRDEHARFEPDDARPDGKADSTTISIGLADPLLRVNIPRLSFDYLVARKFSVGGAVGYTTNDFKADGTLGPVWGPGRAKTFLLAGRVGFLHMFGRVLGIWPRGGLTYESTSFEAGPKASDLGLNLECMFPIVIAPHFGFLPGFTFDQSLTGSVDPGNAPDFNYTYRSFALQFGLFGWI